jgi:hypothetical protein
MTMEAITSGHTCHFCKRTDEGIRACCQCNGSPPTRVAVVTAQISRGLRWADDNLFFMGTKKQAGVDR